MISTKKNSAKRKRIGNQTKTKKFKTLENACLMRKSLQWRGRETDANRNFMTSSSDWKISSSRKEEGGRNHYRKILQELSSFWKRRMKDLKKIWSWFNIERLKKSQVQQLITEKDDIMQM